MLIFYTIWPSRLDLWKLEHFFLLFFNFFSQISQCYFFKFFSKASEFGVVNRGNFERTTWFSETSETAIPENQLEKSPWQ
ncbi:hypothetical protein AL552_12345 [Vibrio diabolicus]|nr:hypothetical protein AL552_12345 [Vibrio diabolicus]MPS38541.1 hypothetical protein [Vibrio sp. VGrn 2]